MVINKIAQSSILNSLTCLKIHLMDISTDTLHYLFSAIPQTLGAVLAVLIAIVFFRINRIQKILVGEGQAVLGRLDQQAYKVLAKWQVKRLEEAVFRDNEKEVKEILKFLNDKEVEEGITKKQRPRGFQYLYHDRFCNTEQYLNRIKTLSFIVALITMITIIASLIALASTYCIQTSIHKECIAICILVFAVASLILTLVLIGYCLLRRTIYEDLDLRDKVVEKNINSE